MSTISVTEEKVGRVFPGQDECVNVVLEEAVEAGEVLYQTNTGTFGLADTGDAAKDEPRGIALESGSAGSTITMIRRGAIYGVDLSGESYDGLVYASDTAGGIDDSAVDEIVGRVMPLADNDATKVLYVTCDQEDDYN